ncbi:MAG: hypothetical protein KDE25_00905 [Novosphingobium sp.]|nr:hypothetical protein [Novosphingobium sp.]
MEAEAQAHSDLTASLPYLRGDLDGLHVEFTARILGDELFDRRPTRIRNGRADGQVPSIDQEGFQLIAHPSATVRDRLGELLEPNGLLNQSDALRAYWAETIPLISRLSGARDVLPLHASTVRYSAALRNDKAMTPAGWPHVDYDTQESQVQLAETLELNQFEPAPYSRYVMYQCWHVLSPPPQDFPLAMCDGRTVSVADIVPIDYHMKTPERDVTYQSSGARYSPRHDWWYFPDMTQQELLVFIGFDSALGDGFKTLHVAIEDETQAKPVPRISLETRYFALFD